MFSVYLNGNDISTQVIEVQTTSLSVGDFGSLISNDITGFLGQNYNQFYDNTSPASPFFGYTDLSIFEVEIYQGGVLVFKGNINQIVVDNQSKTANITMESVLGQALTKYITYISEDIDTPANVIKDLCILFGLEYDSTSFGYANSIYEVNLVFISVYITKAEITLLDLFQQICNYGVGRLYAINNVLYYDVFAPKITSSLYTFSDKLTNEDGITLYSAPIIEPLQKESLEGYNISNVSEFGPAASGTEKQQNFSLDGSTASNIRIMSLPAAVWIGEKWKSYFNTPQSKVRFTTPVSIGNVMELGFPIEIEYKYNQFGVMDIIEINKNNTLYTEIVGLTR